MRCMFHPEAHSPKIGISVLNDFSQRLAPACAVGAQAVPGKLHEDRLQITERQRVFEG